MKKTLTAALLMCLVSSASAQQPVSTRFVMDLDYARFKYDSSQCYLELYYGFYPQLVTMRQEANGAREGFIRFDVELTHKATGETALSEHFVVPVSTIDTSVAASSMSLVSATGYALDHGGYILFARALDSLNQSRRDSIVLDIELEPPADSISLSDLELCSNITRSDETSSLFHKNSLEVVPNPALVFGALGMPVVFSYAEIYNAQPGQTYTLKSSVINGSGATVKESSRPKTYSSVNVVEAGTMNIASLESGRYSFRLEILDETGETLLAERQKIFYIYNPHIQPSLDTRVSAKASELAGLGTEELSREFRYAQYVSTDQVRSLFEKLTAEEGMREFLATMWAGVEAGRMGREPITRVDYLRRVSTANQRYRAFNREGWQTDRGRAYIMYGEPDQVDRYPMQESSKPYEIWHFYQIENGVEFVFVDRTGFNEYILVHSTKRGELRDETWARYLQ
jgi:GWxTD domain-containing protein